MQVVKKPQHSYKQRSHQHSFFFFLNNHIHHSYQHIKKHLHDSPLTSLVLSSSLCSACLEISTSMIFCLSSSFSSSALLRLSSTLSNSLCKRTDTSLATWDHTNTYNSNRRYWPGTKDFIVSTFNTHDTTFVYFYMGSRRPTHIVRQMSDSDTVFVLLALKPPHWIWTKIITMCF